MVCPKEFLTSCIFVEVQKLKVFRYTPLRSLLSLCVTEETNWDRGLRPRSPKSSYVK